jgi:hypothetical protein
VNNTFYSYRKKTVVNLAVFAAFLNVGQDLNKLEGSHLCGSGCCINEPRPANWVRSRCHALCISYCQCNPKCVHQVEGVFVQCKFHDDVCPPVAEPSALVPQRVSNVNF